MNEENLKIKYLVLKIADINGRLLASERKKFWGFVEAIIEQ